MDATESHAPSDPPVTAIKVTAKLFEWTLKKAGEAMAASSNPTVPETAAGPRYARAVQKLRDLGIPV
jgi:hypothetical protein